MQIATPTGTCDSMSDPSLIDDEVDALLQLIIRRIPTIKDPDILKELVFDAIELMLRRSDDHALKLELEQCIQNMFKNLNLGPPSKVRENRERRLTSDCLELIHSAKEKRLPRDIQYP